MTSLPAFVLSMTWIWSTGNTAEFDPEDETEFCPPEVSGSAVYQSSQYPPGTEKLPEVCPVWPVTVISGVNPEPGNAEVGEAVGEIVVTTMAGVPEGVGVTVTGLTEGEV